VISISAARQGEDKQNSAISAAQNLLIDDCLLVQGSMLEALARADSIPS
jgi:hypothetical protein